MEQTLRDILRVLNQMNDRRSRLRTAFLEGIIRGIIVDGQNLVCDSDGEKLIYS